MSIHNVNTSQIMIVIYTKHALNMHVLIGTEEKEEESEVRIITMRTMTT